MSGNGISKVHEIPPERDHKRTVIVKEWLRERKSDFALGIGVISYVGLYLFTGSYCGPTDTYRIAPGVFVKDTDHDGDIDTTYECRRRKSGLETIRICSGRKPTLEEVAAYKNRKEN